MINSDPTATDAAHYVAHNLATAQDTIELGERALVAHAEELALHLEQRRNEIADMHLRDLTRRASERRAAACEEIEQYRSTVAGAMLRQIGHVAPLSAQVVTQVERVQQLLNHAEASIDRLSNESPAAWERSWRQSATNTH
jgi:site-specific recombinase